MPADLQTQRDRRMTIEAMLLALRAGALDPIHRSNRLDIFWHCLEQRNGVAPKSKVLARRLNKSESCISQAVSAAQRQLDDMIKS